VAYAAVETVGVILSISGLASILFGLFLVTSSVGKRKIIGILDNKVFPVFIAGLLFLFNGFGLFSGAAVKFSPSPDFMLWQNLMYGWFYPLAHPLIVLFALYYPRPLHPSLGDAKVKVALLLALPLLKLMTGDLTYYLGIVLVWVAFTYWYRFAESTEREKGMLALMLVGFLFGPLNRWWVLYVGADFLPMANLIMWALEFIAAAAFAVYLIWTGYRIWRKDPASNRREAFLMTGLAIPFIWAATLPVYVNAIWLDPYDIGFAVVRPLCFAVAILQFKMFNINITKKVIIYTTITLFIGFLFFNVKNVFQGILPTMEFLSIIIISVLFLPLSAFSYFVAERLAPIIQNALHLSEDMDASGLPVVVAAPKTLGQHMRIVAVPWFPFQPSSPRYLLAFYSLHLIT
jgi:hypothetical protein